MTRLTPRLIPTLVVMLVCAGLLPAQAPAEPCEPPAEAREGIEKFIAMQPGADPQKTRQERLALIRSLLERFPRDASVHRYYQEFQRYSSDADWEAMIAEYKALSEKHPDDALYEYLYGRALLGRQTPETIARLEKVLERDPGFAWAHLVLAEVRDSPNFRDTAKLRVHLEAFMKLCPSSLAPYRYLRRVEDPEFLRSSAQKLRALLEGRTDTQGLASYSTLWQLEFRLTPLAEHARVRAQVQSDVQKLRQLDLSKSSAWLRALQEGYKLIEDKDGTAWAEAQLKTQLPRMESAFLAAYKQWREKNPPPKPGEPLEKHQAYRRTLLEATAEWVRQWPDERSAWSQRLFALRTADEAAPADVEAAADGLMKAIETSRGTLYSVPPVSIQIATLYAKHGVRLERVPGLVQKGLEESKKGIPGRQSDLLPAESFSPQRNEDMTRWSGWTALLEAHLKLSQNGKAREALMEMETFLEKGKPAEGAPASEKSMYAFRQAEYWDGVARLAEAEGRQLDALVFYQKVLASRPRPSSPLGDAGEGETQRKARRLWKELGGTNEGWQAWLARTEAPSAAAAKEFAAGPRWSKLEKPLPDFKLADLQGRTWRLADLKGKTSLVNVWATWCGPCREELPHFQKIYDRLKDRPDVLVFTLNVDDNLGLIEPYVRQNQFTFPILPARSLVDHLVPALSIPRNWILDPDGVLRQEQVGFGYRENWVDQMIETLEKARNPA